MFQWPLTPFPALAFTTNNEAESWFLDPLYVITRERKRGTLAEMKREVRVLVLI